MDRRTRTRSRTERWAWRGPATGTRAKLSIRTVGRILRGGGPVKWQVGHRAQAAAAHEAGVFRQDPRRVARPRGPPFVAAALQIRVRNLQAERPRFGVDRDLVALLHEGQPSADRRSGTHVADDPAVG